MSGGCSFYSIYLRQKSFRLVKSVNSLSCRLKARRAICKFWVPQIWWNQNRSALINFIQSNILHSPKNFSLSLRVNYSFIRTNKRIDWRILGKKKKSAQAKVALWLVKFFLGLLIAPFDTVLSTVTLANILVPDLNDHCRTVVLGDYRPCAGVVRPPP